MKNCCQLANMLPTHGQIVTKSIYPLIIWKMKTMQHGKLVIYKCFKAISCNLD